MNTSPVRASRNPILYRGNTKAINLHQIVLLLYEAVEMDKTVIQSTLKRKESKLK